MLANIWLEVASYLFEIASRFFEKNKYTNFKWALCIKKKLFAKNNFKWLICLLISGLASYLFEIASRFFEKTVLKYTNFKWALCKKNVVLFAKKQF